MKRKLGELRGEMHVRMVKVPAFSIFFGRGDLGFHAGSSCGEEGEEKGVLRYEMYLNPHRGLGE